MRDAAHKGRIRNNPRHGVSNEWSKLTEADVKEARSLHAAGVSYRKLAASYGVTLKTIWNAVKMKSWKHV